MKPNIYYFNPTCELAVANGSTNFMASAKLRCFEDELSTLPGLLAQPEDMVLVNRRPSKLFTDQLERAGFKLPGYQVFEEAISDSQFLTIQKGFLFPWGWSPSAHKQLSPLKPTCCSAFLNSPVAEWREIHRELYSRKTSLELLTQIVSDQKLSNILTISDLPKTCTTQEQIISLQLRWGKVVVKAPWSASGRGLQHLRPNEFNQTNKQVISGILKQQGYVVVEPWHDKQIDLSFQFFSKGDGDVEYKGLTTFSTDPAGHYTGNYIQQLPQHIATDLQDFIAENLLSVKNEIHRILRESAYSTEYYGWIGVDALIFKTAKGALKFHPCLEINCRFTMGAIALKIREHLAEHSDGVFRITHGKDGDFNKFCGEMSTKAPLIVEGGKMVRGFLPLIPPLSDSSFGAYLTIVMRELRN